MSFQPKYSKTLQKIIRDLKNGNQQKCVQLIYKKVTKTLAAPEIPETFKEGLVDDYRAAKMGNRFRLFYKVYQQHNIISLWSIFSLIL